jgi:hypothetical protein
MQGHRFHYSVENFFEDRPNRLGIWIEGHGHGDRAFVTRCKFPLTHRFFRGIRQCRVPTQHLNVLHASIRVDGHLQTHRSADAPALQNGRILRFDLLHYFAFSVLRPGGRKAKSPQK